MPYLLLGAAAYPVLFLYDLFALRKRRLLSWASGALGVALLAAAFALIVRTAPRLAFPAAVTIAGWIGAPPAFLLLIYSLFAELPLAQAKLAGSGLAPGRPALVVTGTYALTRHPGVLWWALLLVCLAAAEGRPLLFAAAAVWTAANALYVAAQERYLFTRLFGPSYEAYRRTTPMLIPTPASLRRCLATWRGGA